MKFDNTINIPDQLIYIIAEPSITVKQTDISKSLQSDSCFAEWKNLDGKVLVIVNDGTRPTPTAEVISSDKDFFGSDHVHYIVATGAHRGPRDAEWGFIFGELYNSIKSRIHVHDANDRDSLEYYGTTSRRTKVSYNKILKGFDRILVIGSVEPHYFAGFTGGRKGFLPGIAGYDTITDNHKLALEPDSGLLRLAGNPVHEDMVEAARLISSKSIFSIMTVLDAHQNIYSIHSGGLTDSFEAAAASARQVFQVRLQTPADIIITYASAPMNKDLYQSQKAIENVRGALSPGGVIILVSECRDGIGSSNFYDLLAAENTPEAVLDAIRLEYRLGYHKAAKLAGLAAEANIFAVTTIEPALLEKVFIRPFSSLQKAFDSARSLCLEQKKREPVVLTVPDGSVTVPTVKNTQRL